MRLKSYMILGALAASAASRASFFNNSYLLQFSDPNVNFTVSNIYILERNLDPVNHFDYGFRLPGDQVTAPTGGTITDYKDILTQPATSALIIAETNELPGDAPGQKHIMLGMSDDAASYAKGIGWGTLFTSTLEDDIIYGLDHYVDADPAVTSDALQKLVNFAYGDAQSGILDNQAQSHSAWFAPNGSFSLLTWSDGLQVGSGINTQIETTPEPGTLAALGLGGLALLRRRRR